MRVILYVRWCSHALQIGDLCQWHSLNKGTPGVRGKTAVLEDKLSVFTKSEVVSS